MSQESLINDVSTWSRETRKQKLDETLPKLLISFSQYCNGTSSAVKVDILRTMVESLLPIIEVDRREVDFLCPVMPQTKGLFENVCSAILDALQQSSSSQDLHHSLNQNLALLVEIITVLESCIQQLMPPRGQMVNMDTIDSLPCNILAVIKQSFSHCKESHSVYGEHFSAAAEQLSTLFKRAYSLQKALMALLESISDSGCHGDHLSQVCSGFHDLCSIISGMDTTLLVSTWRFLVKLVSRHRDTIHSSFQAAPLVTSLCSEVESHYRHALQLAPRPPPEGGGSQGGGSQGGDEKAFARTLKVCSLCFKMLNHVLKEFVDECLEQSAPKVLELLLLLQSLIPPNPGAQPINEGALSDVQRSVLVGIEPLLQLFLPSRDLCASLLATNKEHPSHQNLPRLLTVLLILKLLPLATEDAQAAWLDPVLFPEDEPHEDVISGVFSAVTKCYVELHLPVTLPGVMCQGKPLVDVSLHEHVVTHLCGFLAALPAKYFHAFEECLLKNTLGSCWSCVMIAADVWCFLARYSSAELCYQHVRFLFDLLTSIPSNQSPAYLHVSLLLRRLIPLMASEHQLELISAFAIEKHLALWASLPPASLPDSSRDLLCDKVITTCVKALSDWEDSSKRKEAASAEHLIESIWCLRTFFATNHPIAAGLSQRLAEALSRLYSVLSLDKLSQAVLGSLLEVSAHLLQHLKSGHIAELLHTACAAVGKDSPLTLRLACINFLRKLGKGTPSACPEQAAILANIPVLFAKVLSDPCFVIHQQALEAFSLFAEETCHEAVVPECIREEEVQTKVVDYLNQIPAHADLLLERSEVDLLSAQGKHLGEVCERLTGQTLTEDQATNRTEQTCAPGENAMDVDETTPQSKRRRGDAAEAYTEACANLREALRRLSELRKDASTDCPDWVRADLSDARQHLDELMGDTVTSR
ncbi:LOW QUALITY PROTEIN: FIGNL1-interacting regulator of recombination and mitosis-like [Diadema antillarum]|uniref:LOW QUALITY PROTEIN: FIGNL1-interacting regulator of recombination and mitosis-like n=1 Tax=Diadema antillarum TaxID=105358 RepID=UPI003A8A3BA0